MEKVIIVTSIQRNKIIGVYKEDANIPELYKHKRDMYSIEGHIVKNGIQYEVESNKLDLKVDNSKYFQPETLMNGFKVK
jgi:hypothetical protein